MFGQQGRPSRTHGHFSLIPTCPSPKTFHRASLLKFPRGPPSAEGVQRESIRQAQHTACHFELLPGSIQGQVNEFLAPLFSAKVFQQESCQEPVSHHNGLLGAAPLTTFGPGQAESETAPFEIKAKMAPVSRAQLAGAGESHEANQDECSQLVLPLAPQPSAHALYHHQRERLDSGCTFGPPPS